MASSQKGNNIFYSYHKKWSIAKINPINFVVRNNHKKRQLKLIPNKYNSNKKEEDSSPYKNMSTQTDNMPLNSTLPYLNIESNKESNETDTMVPSHKNSSSKIQLLDEYYHSIIQNEQYNNESPMKNSSGINRKKELFNNEILKKSFETIDDRFQYRNGFYDNQEVKGSFPHSVNLSELIDNKMKVSDYYKGDPLIKPRTTKNHFRSSSNISVASSYSLQANSIGPKKISNRDMSCNYKRIYIKKTIDLRKDMRKISYDYRNIDDSKTINHEFNDTQRYFQSIKGIEDNYDFKNVSLLLNPSNNNVKPHSFKINQYTNFLNKTKRRCSKSMHCTSTSFQSLKTCKLSSNTVLRSSNCHQSNMIKH